jgi:hypothetical protein
LLAVGAIGFGAVGVMSLLERRGEAAISLIPSDAALAISFDNTPSPSQVMLFREISNAMEDGGVNRFVDKMMDDMNVPPQVRAIKENLKGSFAVGLWGDLAGGKPDMVLAAALNSTASAENVLREHGKRLEDISVPAYQMDGEVIIAFYDDYALVTNSADSLKRAIEAGEGRLQSLDDVEAFKSARESLPSDASFMLFANGEAIANADEDTRRMYEAMGIDKAGWAAIGATVVDAGIQLDMYQDMQGGGELTTAYEAIPELTYSSANRLPAGAIGVLAISDAGRMVDAMLESVSASEMGADVDKGLSEMEKEIGLSFDTDVLPALAGETYVALYPPTSKEDDEPRFVIMFDEQNGATPEKAARKLIAKVDEFTAKKVGEVEVFAAEADEPVIAIAPEQVVITNDVSIISEPTESALTDSGSLAKFDDGQPAKFKIQVDLRKLFATIREFVGEDMPNIESALSQDSFECSWTVESGVSKGRALIPFKLPELIRIAGKELNKVSEEGMGFPSETTEGGPSMDEIGATMKSKDEVLKNGKEMGVAFLLYAEDHDGKFPEYQEFLDGALQPYLKNKKVEEDFIYMPPMKDSDPKTTQLGSFMAEGGRVVVFKDGRAEFESYEDWGE